MTSLHERSSLEQLFSHKTNERFENKLPNLKMDIIYFFDENEDCILSSSSSSDDDDDIYSALDVLKVERHSRTAVKNYEMVIREYRDVDFIKHYRMSRDKVNYVTEKFAISDVYLDLIKTENSRASITAEKHILVFLWFAGHQTASFRDVADRFDLCLSSLHDVVTRVLHFLSSFASELIKWPSTTQKQKTMDFYYKNKLFPNVIGAIDGTHIKIDKPSKRAVDYFNRKDCYSMVLQGVCDEELNFIDIFIGYPGSVHDARIFRNFTLFEDLETLCNGCYLLGDSAYPLLHHLLTPYRDNGHLTAAQKYFNKKLSSCRVSIEHAFGLLKNRFRQLYHIKLRGHERICHFIRACCVLHNIASKDDITIFEADESAIDDEPETIPVREVFETGSQTRNEICYQLNLNKK